MVPKISNAARPSYKVLHLGRVAVRAVAEAQDLPATETPEMDTRVYLDDGTRSHGGYTA